MSVFTSLKITNKPKKNKNKKNVNAFFAHRDEKKRNKHLEKSLTTSSFFLFLLFSYKVCFFFMPLENLSNGIKMLTCKIVKLVFKMEGEEDCKQMEQ